MGFFNAGRNQTITTEIRDGYCIVGFKESFLKKIKKDFEIQSDNDYENFKKSCEENNGIPVIPSNFNAIAAKQRMQIESAIDDNNVVGIQITETNDCTFDNQDYTYIEKKLMEINAETALIQTKDTNFFICNNNESNINLVTNTIYEEILNKREQSGIGITKYDGFLIKEIPFNEEMFIKEKIAEEITRLIYLGNEEMALNLLSNDDKIVKIILQEKHKKDVQKILNYLQIQHLLYNDSFIINLNDLNFMCNTIDDYMHGAIVIKDKNIYGLNIRREVNQQSTERNNQSIDNIINELKDKKRDNNIARNYNEISK